MNTQTEHNLHLVNTLTQLQRLSALVAECRTNEAAEWGCEWIGSSFQDGELVEYYLVPVPGLEAPWNETTATVNRDRGETLGGVVERIQRRAIEAQQRAQAEPKVEVVENADGTQCVTVSWGEVVEASRFNAPALLTAVVGLAVVVGILASAIALGYWLVNTGWLR